ncbi:MAG: class I SAM-dependent methyltransferase [Syntrophorhabdales bacterium]|jgi:predicted O-methyltransferase YrrM
MNLENEALGNPRLDVKGIATVIDAYSACGYEVLLSNPDCLTTHLHQKGRLVNTSAGISLTDILVLQWVGGFAPWRRALVIGNAFGFSTFVIASLSSGCYVDAIDAEIEGSENRLGSDLTRRIANHYFPGVQLTTGFSPQDLTKACRFEKYDLIFIDGMHTSEQLVADFSGIKGRRAESSVVYCHDVGMAGMRAGWDRIKTVLLDQNDGPFELHFTNFGCTMVVSGNPELSDFLGKICRPLGECLFYFGARHIGLRSALRMLARTIRYSTPGGRWLQSFIHRQA